MNREIIELTNETQWRQAFPLMAQLRPTLTIERYLELLPKMMKNNYRLFAMVEQDQFLVLAGVDLITNLYNGYHVFLYDLVVDENQRSRGLGAEMLEFVHNWGRSQGAEYVSLESALHREAAHRFYENHEYDKWCYSFRKKL
ncbi:GNAT family N-acetyltransferase [Bacillus sp. REN10]|uniref:GNAT family N-acetyltransferase n=1 Tax=Bacillus sp. REN10 TaxID=2782541 RepID=UPI00193C1560|nr:GNAT family N-acetyltransferase [Bacillus sp. REN10]